MGCRRLRRTGKGLCLFLAVVAWCLIFSLASVFFHGNTYAAQITLAWDAEDGAAGYKIYYGTASGVYTTAIDVGNATSCPLTLADGHTYYIVATAYDPADLESDFSGEIIYAAGVQPCSYTLAPAGASLSASGGSGTISVTTQSECPWSASTGVSWITVTSGVSGTGSGKVAYDVTPNTGLSRTAASMIAGKVFTFSQSGVSSYIITATAGTGGSISPSGSVKVTSGANQSFAIAPNTGYNVSGVTIDGTPVGAITSYTFSNVKGNHTIAAAFTAKTYTISATAGTGGSTSPSGGVSVTYGSNKTFAIKPNTGYSISDVTIDGTSVGAIASYTFSNVKGNHTIAAAFTVKTYTISATAGTGGSISPSGSVSMTYGSSKAFVITPGTGYSISDVTVDGASVGAVTSYTFTGVKGNHSIAATFTQAYTISASAGTGGSISPSGSVSVAGGSSQSFIITPSTGYFISSVMVDGAPVGAVTSYTFTNVAAAHTIEAIFTATSKTIYYLTVQKGGSGSGKVTSSPSTIDCGTFCRAGYKEGTKITLTPVPESGSVFTGWTGACKGDRECSIIMSADKTVEATFDIGSCSYTVIPHNGTLAHKGGAITVRINAKDHFNCAAPEIINNGDWITHTVTAFTNNAGYVKLTNTRI